jgi:hypothetical protein
MKFDCLHSKDEIERFCRLNPALHLYALGNLDDFTPPETAPVQPAQRTLGKNNSQSIFCTALHTDCTPIAHRAVNNRSRQDFPTSLRTSHFSAS